MPDDASISARLQAGSEPESAPCYHCGLPATLPARWQVDIAGVARTMCCPGCAAVADAIVELGQDNYYLNRDQYAASAAGAELVPPELALYDNADPRFARDADSRAATLAVDGIRCAACVWLIEQRLSRLPGVLAATMNVATEKLHVRWDAALCQPADILRALHAIGYAAYPYDAARHGRQLQRGARTLGRQLFVAGLCMMQVMMYVAPAYLASAGTLEPAMASLMRWASLLLTLPAICYSAQPFLRGAVASLRARRPGMDVPVALGIGAAFGASVVATVRGHGDVYFDTVTMFIFLLLCSRYLELRARRGAASALERLQHALPASATRLDAYPASRDGTLVAATALMVGDVIQIKPGEAAAADCIALDGASAFDLSLLSGESAPQTRRAGEAIAGGAINVGAALLARVTRRAGDSTLSALIKLADGAGRDKPRLALWADRVGAWFVAALLLLALATLAFWHWHDAARAWPIAIAVLVVSCPCALSLATPSALAAATDRLLRGGMLVVGAHTLETLQRASHIVFDKTGTLTRGTPQLQHIEPRATLTRAACLDIAAALEAHSAHPLARAVLAATEVATCRSASDVSATPRAELKNTVSGQRRHLAAIELMEKPGPGPSDMEPGRRQRLVATDVTETPGLGLEGTILGQRYRLGSEAYAAELSGTPVDHAHSHGMTPLYLAMRGQSLARLLLADIVRDDARATLDYFRAAGKKIIILSGDNDALTRRVAAELGADEARGACLPADKLAYVQHLQAQGAVVAMVGDGINDAAVLGAADVSFAMGAGAALAQAHADAVLLSGRLGAVADCARMARRTMRVMRQNLAWAALYNLAAIPAAALGYLNPWLSGVGMALSSALVVANALRLRRG